ncbi:MAG: c-type cytochrome [Nitrospinae bacterium]|nr:c-type cytochrome [Nitrospinota bacterium]MBF0633708.1 c-type cytochrome [Nitrospinota bacterium]
MSVVTWRKAHRFFGLAVTAVVAALCVNASAVHASPGSAEDGRKLYLAHCQQCHGLDGKGDGSASAYLMRRPRNFTEGLYKIKTSQTGWLIPRDEDIFGVISNGMSSSGMPPYANILTEGERWSLVTYLKSLSDAFGSEGNPPALDYSNPVAYSPDSVQRGEKVYYRLKCVECHGPEGSGPASKNLKDDYGEPIWPRDLTRPSTFIGPYTPEALYSRVTNGIPLTPMPQHATVGGETLSAQDRWDVVNYITWLKDEAETKRRNWTIAFAATLAVAVFIGRAWITRLIRTMVNIGKPVQRD